VSAENVIPMSVEITPLSPLAAEVDQALTNVRANDSQITSGDDASKMLSTFDLIECVLPVLRRYLAVNPRTNTSNLGYGYCVPSEVEGIWVRSPQAATAFRPSTAALLKALGELEYFYELSVGYEKDQRQRARVLANRETLRRLQKSAAQMKKSVRSWQQVISASKSDLMRGNEWFDRQVLLWLLSRPPMKTLMTDARRAYNDAGYPSGLSWTTHVIPLLKDLGVVRNHSGTEVLRLDLPEVRSVLADAANGVSDE
jgi:hypothetical protein